ncbi:MAG TPA: hypothetical protein VEK11_13515 [Thermoanaerobaculia bacterium]|nr:hypothetical protein [Thermoanaerobaculia bacterium]
MITLTRTQRRTLLTTTIVTMSLVLLLFLVNPGIARDPDPPEDAQALAAWFAEHPADWKSAAALSDRSLDSALPRRIELWRASFEAGRALAPWRTNPPAGFVRAGLFHWYELNEADRALVLQTATPLMRSDTTLFHQLHQPLYRLTRDLDYLQRSAPQTVDAFSSLRELAARHGRFNEYRGLRALVRRVRRDQFLQRRANGEIAELLAMLPHPLRKEDEPLVRAMLAELDRRVFDPAQLHGGVEELTVYALDHKLQPLGGLTPLIASETLLRETTRLRLARESGNAEAARRLELSTTAHLAPRPQVGVWEGLCGVDELCAGARGVHRGPLTLTLDVAQSDEIPPYVEIYVDDALVAEGEIHEARTFAVIGDTDEHRVEMRMINPTTRSGIQRRVKFRSAGGHRG